MPTFISLNDTQVKNVSHLRCLLPYGSKISRILDNIIIIHRKIVLGHDDSYFTKIFKD